MEKDALIVYVDWKKIAAWKVLSLPEKVTDRFFPIAYGSNNNKFGSWVKTGSTIWIVTKPELKTIKYSLVAKIVVKHSFKEEDCPVNYYRRRGIMELYEIYSYVAISNPEKSAFFEFNDASSVLKKLKVKFVYGLSDFRGQADYVQKAFSHKIQSNKERTVFLSYTHKESKNYTLKLVDQLRENGFSIWLDSLTLPLYDEKMENTPLEQRLSKLIQIGLFNSNLVIVLGTDYYGNTKWTATELGWIYRRRKETKHIHFIEIIKGNERKTDFKIGLEVAPPARMAQQITEWWENKVAPIKGLESNDI